MKSKQQLVLCVAGLLPTLCLPALPAESGTQQVKLAVELGRPVASTNTPQKAYVKIGLEGLPLPDASSRPPVNLAIVLDRSSSMEGEKIEKAKEAALMVIDRLGPEDVVSVVTYDSGVQVLIPATKLRDRTRFRRLISSLRPRGSTALFAGVSSGIAEVRRFLDPGRVNRVILISDGLANIGPSSPQELGRLGAAAAKEGIAVTTIGLGLGYNEDLMMQLALKSDGNHAFAETATELARLFDAELGDVLSVVAQEVAIKVRFPKGVRPVRTLNRSAEIVGQTAVMHLGQLYGRQEKYFLLEVELPVRRNKERLEVARAEVSYSNMVTGKTERLAAGVQVRFSSSKREVAKAENREVMIAAVEAIANERNRLAVRLLDEGRQREAQRVLRSNATFLGENAGAYKSNKLRDLQILNNEDAESMGNQGWNRRRKKMRHRQVQLEQQQSY